MEREVVHCRCGHPPPRHWKHHRRAGETVRVVLGGVTYALAHPPELATHPRGGFDLLQMSMVVAGNHQGFVRGKGDMCLLLLLTRRRCYYVIGIRGRQAWREFYRELVRAFGRHQLPNSYAQAKELHKAFVRQNAKWSNFQLHRKWEDFVVPEGEALGEEEEEEANENVEEQTEAYPSEADDGASEEYLGYDASPPNQARPAEPLSGHSDQARRAARETSQDAPDWAEAEDYLSLTDELERRLRKLEIKRRRLMSEFSADMERKKREVSRQRTLVAQERQRLRQRARKRARQARGGRHPLILKQEETTSD